MKIETRFALGDTLWIVAGKRKRVACSACGLERMEHNGYAVRREPIRCMYIKRGTVFLSTDTVAMAFAEPEIDTAGRMAFTTREAAEAEAARRNAREGSE